MGHDLRVFGHFGFVNLRGAKPTVGYVHILLIPSAALRG